MEKFLDNKGLGDVNLRLWFHIGYLGCCIFFAAGGVTSCIRIYIYINIYIYNINKYKYIYIYIRINGQQGVTGEYQPL